MSEVWKEFGKTQVEQRARQVVGEYLDTLWSGARLEGFKLNQNLSELMGRYQHKLLTIVFDVRENGVRRRYRFAPVEMLISNDNSPIMLSYRLCEEHKKAHVHILYADEGTVDDYRRARRIIKTLGEGDEKVSLSAGGQPKDIYDEIFPLIKNAEIAPKQGYDMYCKHLQSLGEKPKKRSSFDKAMQRRRQKA